MPATPPRYEQGTSASGLAGHCIQQVEYVSTRGMAPRLAFDDVVLAGLARDGGLYVPATWPVLTPDALESMAGLAYPSLAAKVLVPFAAPVIDGDTLAAITADAYRNFDHPEIAPLRQIGDGEWLLELFHGPTLAFKDFALQVLGRLFDLILARRGERVTIVGATSGDTGSAAIEACRDREAIEIFILHPKGRVSEVQRRQMTTVNAANVHNIAIEGTFDDCQDLVKAMFNDAPFRDRMSLSAVNSINWARIAAQVVYYFAASLRLGTAERPIDVAVPTGNFGNVFAGYVARAVGAPIRRLIVGSNRNDILTRFFETGTLEIGTVYPTLSPSMDIQVSSNFERFVFELFDRDGVRVAEAMNIFRRDGRYTFDADTWRRAREVFAATRLDDNETKAIIALTYREAGVLLDPHSAIGVAAARACREDTATPVVSIATAHPAKFPDAVAAATGEHPALPPRMAGLMQREERYTTLPPVIAAIKDHVAATVERRRTAS